MESVRLTVRVEIVDEAQDQVTNDPPRGLDGIEQQVVRTIDSQSARSLDDFEELLLDGAYEVMRAALGEHFEQVAKRGLYRPPAAARTSPPTRSRTESTAVPEDTSSPPGE